MIRNALFLAALIGAATLVRAQQKPAAVRVILAKDTALYGISPAKLAKTHILLNNAFVEHLPAAKRELVRRQLIDHQRDVEGYRALPKVDANYTIRTFYRADGTVDWVVIDAKPAGNAELSGALIRAETIAYRTNQLKLPLNKPFLISSAHSEQIGLQATTRRTRWGSHAVNTLAEIRLTNRPDTVRQAFLHDLGLTAIPDELYRLSNLEELDLSQNALTQIPARLTADLPHLQRLNLSGNLLETEGMTFAANTSLRELNLVSNWLTELPISLVNTPQLTKFWLTNNRIKALDDNVVAAMTQLRWLDLDKNVLTALPGSIGKLTNLTGLKLDDNRLTQLPAQLGVLTSLERLTITKNRLSALPDELANLTRLRKLVLYDNALRQLPDGLFRLTNLLLLDLSRNEFTEVPTVVFALPALTELDLTTNRLKAIPARLAQMPTLKTLYLRNNPITHGDAKAGRYARVIDQLEKSKTDVFY